MKMIKKILAVLILSAPIYAKQNPTIIENSFSFVNISLTDVNRISCPYTIKWFTYSKEKEIQITKANKNLLVKIIPKVIVEGNEEKIVRDSFPRELLVECGNQVFTLILVPKKIPTQTIILKPKFADTKKALKFETSNDYETTIKELIVIAKSALQLRTNKPKAMKIIPMNSFLVNFSCLPLPQVKGVICWCFWRWST